MSLKSNLRLIYGAAFVRAVGVGLVSVLLGVYLAQSGHSAAEIGMVIGAGMTGLALATLLVSFRAEHFGRRRMLVVLSLLTALGGLGLSLPTYLPIVVLVAFFGLVNGMGRDRGPAFALDQALIPEMTRPERRTWALAWYNVVLDAGHAAGALAGLLPAFFRNLVGVGWVDSYRIAFLLSASMGLLGACIYRSLALDIETSNAGSLGARRRLEISPDSRRVVGKLAFLSGLDSIGGGFLPTAILAYWFFVRFGVGEETLAPLFFVARTANAGSYGAAAWLARRVGLLQTMVFTHIPSSLFLLAVPFAPSVEWAMGLFLARECLVEMDVPTRQSYIVAVVEPHERTYASGITNLTRNLAWAVGPSVAGQLMHRLSLAAPLFLGSGIKIAYDVLLFHAFRRLKPPEER